MELPLAALFDPEVFGNEEFSARGFTVSAGAYRYGGVRVWGATALTLGMLAHVLEGVAADRLAAGLKRRLQRGQQLEQRRVLGRRRRNDADARPAQPRSSTTGRRRGS